MQAPEIGRLVAEQIADGAISSIDVTALRIERFADIGHRQRVELVF